MKRYVIHCQCPRTSHMVVLCREGDEFWFEFLLSPYLSIKHRLWAALKYVVWPWIRPEWDSVMPMPNELEALKRFLNETCK